MRCPVMRELRLDAVCVLASSDRLLLQPVGQLMDRRQLNQLR